MQTGWRQVAGLDARTVKDDKLQTQYGMLADYLSENTYGYWYQNAGIIIFSVVLTRFLTVLHFGWGWVILVLAGCASYYALSMSRTRAPLILRLYQRQPISMATICPSWERHHEPRIISTRHRTHHKYRFQLQRLTRQRSALHLPVPIQSIAHEPRPLPGRGLSRLDPTPSWSVLRLSRSLPLRQSQPA